MNGMIYKGRKTKVMVVPYGRRRFLTGVILLVFCLCLFCSDARAVYQIINVGNSDVNGLYSSGSGTWNGSDFGSVSQPGWVIGIAYNEEAYGIFADGGSLTITGEFGSGGTIGGVAGTYHAYGLYSSSGDSIHTDALNGFIYAITGENRAVALFAEDGDVNTGDIGGRVEATAGTHDAYGLRSDYGDIITGAINGTITVIAETDRAAGLRSHGSILTGDINGTISATAGGHKAYGLRSDYDLTTGAINGEITAIAATYYAAGLVSDYNSITTGAINGTITATAGTYDAYGLYSPTGSITTGAIDGTISATAEDGYAYGLYSNGLTSIHIGDINGTISADVNDGSYAYALYSNSDITVGNIGSDAEITATARGDDAYGLYSVYGDVNTGNIDGTITATAGGNDAAGLYSMSGSVFTGAINGTITATAASTENLSAYGIYGNDSVTTGDINGVISAEMTNGSGAYAIYAVNDITVGNIGSDANISATAEYGDAYGMYSGGGGDSVHIGDINGTISADVNNGSYAYALYSDSNITVGNIGSDAEITATANNGGGAGGLRSNGSIDVCDIDGTITVTADRHAYGLRTDGGDITTGAINGDISTTVEGVRAYGLYSNGGSININGDVNGTITATAGARAYGLRSDDGSITTGAINGDITATASTGSYAYGLYSDNNSITTGVIDGNIAAEATNGSGAYALYSGSDMNIASIGSNANITATAGDEGAYGLYGDDSITTGDIDGVITATAENNYAFGIYDNSGDSMYTGEINGTITADANTGSYAYALYSYGHIDIDDIGTGAEIKATTGDSYAIGIYSLGSDSLTTGAISGTIDVNAGGDFAYGILSYGPMDVFVDGGTISAVAVAGPNVAAIQSGRINGSVLETQDANDTLGIVAGSTIVGDIDLAQNGSDDDLLTLSGVNTNSTTFGDDIMNIETIDITGGTWYVDGTVSNSTNGITMYGGILSGTGTLCSLHVIDGKFAPGSSIGTIIIDGNWIHEPNGIYEVEVDNSENADLTIVMKWVDLDGTIRGKAPTVTGQRIDHSFSALVIDANTGLYDAFDTVTGTTLFPIYSVTYDYVNYDVNLNVEFDYAHYAVTDNQRSVGEAFNYIVVNGLDTGDMNDVLWAIEHLPDGDAANNAYNQLMPQDMLGLPDITRRMMNQHNDSVLDRMDNIRTGRQYAMLPSNRYLLASADNSVALPPQTNKWMPFVKGVGVWGDRDAESDIAGYDYSVYGVVAGMDKLVSDNSLFGFGVGGSRANVDYSQASTNADIDSFLCSLHGSYFENDWHLDWTAAYAHSWYDSQRSIRFDAIDRKAKSDHQGDAYSAAIEFGKNLGGTSMILEPIAGFGYTYVRQRGYKEKGADALNLKVGSDTTDGFYSKLGIRAATEIRSEENSDMVMVPKLSAFWIHDFAERVELSSSFIDGGSFTTEGHDPIRDTLNLGAGLNIYFSNNLRLFVDYSWQSSSNFNANMAQAGVQWSF